MTDRTVSIDGVNVPCILYGTAWKEAETQRLTELALKQGFRGIDTANQRRHYDEASVGKAVTSAIASGLVARGDLFLQTKFTFRAGQDHRLPYDPAAPIATQVAQSFASSLEHFGVDAIDSYVLHGPMLRVGLSRADGEAWSAMEAIHDSGRTKFLGVSNVSLEQLQLLCDGARIRPRFVQNRCFAALGWDHAVRQYCTANGIIYQGFSVLTANREVLAAPEIGQIAQRYSRTASQIIFRFALDIGMMFLTGTTDPAHMQADLSIFDFHLDREEIAQIERLAVA